MKKNIAIIINGFEENIPEASTLANLIDHFKEEDKDLIVELNGKFVHAVNYATTSVKSGDVIEFINPHFGG